MIHDASMHRQVWDRIPWIVNGSLPQSERLAVEAHLKTCAECREELEFQRRLAVSMAHCNSPDIDPQVSWQRVRQRIIAIGPAPSAALDGQTRVPGIELRAVRQSGRWVPWLVAALVLQAIALGALGTMLWSRSADRTPVTIRAVFAADISVGKMQALLAAAGLQVRSGPSSAGVWSLEPAGEAHRSSTQFALSQLRANPEVAFAEAVAGSP
jgi:anti-sigma factor RsiW